MLSPDIELSCQDLAAELKQGVKLLVIDVREDWEVARAEFRGAVHIPLGKLEAYDFEVDPSSALVVLCHHGYRSLQAALYLRSRGFLNVRNLRGGIDAWSENIDHTIAKY